MLSITNDLFLLSSLSYAAFMNPMAPRTHVVPMNVG